jgi:hypothetical protein
MRKRILLAAASVAAMSVALLLPMSSASADGTTVITAGPSQYTLGFTHPTGTLTVSGGTISARCTAAAFKGSHVTATPRCTTRKVTCPITAVNGCAVVVNFQENALRGPVAFVAGSSVTGFTGFATLSPYNCPQAFNCSWKFAVGLNPGGTIQSQILNILDPNYVTVFAQNTLTVN